MTETWVYVILVSIQFSYSQNGDNDAGFLFFPITFTMDAIQGTYATCCFEQNKTASVWIIYYFGINDKEVSKAVMNKSIWQ